MPNRVAHLTLSTPPPSVNGMTTVSRGRKIKSDEGKIWHHMAVYELNGQAGLPGPCFWRADILVPASKTKCDLDNLCKGILDALGAAGKTPDDRYLVDLRIRFHGGDTVKIAIKQEDLSTWATIKQISKALQKKLMPHTA